VQQGPQDFTLITPEDATSNERVSVTLDAGASKDPDGDTLTFEWDFDNEGVFDDGSAASVVFDRVGKDGVFQIAARVSDPSGAFDVAAATVTVVNVPPAFRNLVTNSPQTITFGGTSFDEGWLDPLAVTVDWGDGTPLESVVGNMDNNPPQATLAFDHSHNYNDPGDFTIAACASDDDETACSTVEVQVQSDFLLNLLLAALVAFLAKLGFFGWSCLFGWFGLCDGSSDSVQSMVQWWIQGTTDTSSTLLFPDRGFMQYCIAWLLMPFFGLPCTWRGGDCAHPNTCFELAIVFRFPLFLSNPATTALRPPTISGFLLLFYPWCKVRRLTQTAPNK